MNLPFRLFIPLFILCFTWFPPREAVAQSGSKESLSDSLQIKQYIKEMASLMGQGMYEKVHKSLDSALISSNRLGNKLRIAHILDAKGVQFRVQGEYDSALRYHHLAQEISQQINDRNLIASDNLNLGLAYMKKGLYKKAQKHLYKSLNLYEEIGDQKGTGLANLNLGIFYGMNGNDSMAIESFNNAANTFRILEKPDNLSYALINLGNAYNSRNQYEPAIKALTEGLAILETHPDNRAKINCLNQIGRAYMKNDQGATSLPYFKEAIQMAESAQNTYYLYLSNNYYAQALSNLDRNQEALVYAKKAKAYSDKMGPHQEAPNTLETLYHTYANLGRYQDAYLTLRKFVAVKDSLFNKEKSRQLTRMQTEFETERKERKIETLDLEAKAERLKGNILAIGLAATLVLGFLVFWNQRIKRKKDQEIRKQQKEVEAQKLRNARLEKNHLETELNYKQRELEQKEKELSSQVLQLARKNEFLRSLGEEVDKISPHVGEEGAGIARSLSKTIARNLDQEAEWEVFLESFKSVHKDFFVNLVETHPSLSANELRLIALMKMNLSGKEIADLLHVTDAAVKKSRYRLRKKLGFSSEVNLQAYFLSRKFA